MGVLDDKLVRQSLAASIAAGLGYAYLRRRSLSYSERTNPFYVAAGIAGAGYLYVNQTDPKSLKVDVRHTILLPLLCVSAYVATTTAATNYQITGSPIKAPVRKADGTFGELNQARAILP